MGKFCVELPLRTPGRILALSGALPLFLSRLGMVSVEDGGNQSWKALVDFRAARGVVHFDALAFAANQSRLPEGLEMLGKGRFRDGLLADIQEIRAIVRTDRADNPGINGDPHGIGEGMKDAFDREVVRRGMKKWPH